MWVFLVLNALSAVWGIAAKGEPSIIVLNVVVAVVLLVQLTLEQA